MIRPVQINMQHIELNCNYVVLIKLFIFNFLLLCNGNKDGDNTINILEGTDLSKDSDKYKCVVEKKREHCTAIGETTNNIYGPRFQKVHLELSRINPVKVNYSRKINIIKGKQHEMKTISVNPPIFEVRNFLESEDCEAIIQLAKEKGMTHANRPIKKLDLPDYDSHEVFDLWDTNLDGFLSKEEVISIAEIGHLLLKENDITLMFQTLNLDADKSGTISYGELAHVSFRKLKEYLEELNKNLAHATVKDVEHVTLWQDEDELLVFDDVFYDYHERLTNLTMIPEEIIKEGEPLQIMRYKNGSFSECHHDSEVLSPLKPCCSYGKTNCRLCRYISILYFLNDVEEGQGGEIVFPLADNATYLWKDLHKETTRRCANAPNISLANLVIKPEKGKAIMWYNHRISHETGWLAELDPWSFYGSPLITGGEKWIALTWIPIVGDGINELIPWKIGNNWLSKNNINMNVINKMRNDDFIEGEKYYHHNKLKYYEKGDNKFTAIPNNSKSKTKAHLNKDKVNQEKSNLHNKKKKKGDLPLGPPPSSSNSDPLKKHRIVDNKLVQSVLLLIGELERDELEVIARNLHERLQLACIPIIINPIGKM